MSWWSAIGNALSSAGGYISNAVSGGANSVYNAFSSGFSWLINQGAEEGQKIALSIEETIVEKIVAFIVSAFALSGSAIDDMAEGFVNTVVYLASFGGPFGPMIAFVILFGAIVGVVLVVHIILTLM